MYRLKYLHSYWKYRDILVKCFLVTIFGPQAQLKWIMKGKRLYQVLYKLKTPSGKSALVGVAVIIACIISVQSQRFFSDLDIVTVH